MANLITVDEYKQYKGINSTAQDTQIEVIIGLVSALIKNICRNSIVDYVSNSKQEIFSGGVDKFLLEEYPIITINSVQHSDDYGQTYSSLTEFTDWVWDSEQLAIVSLAGLFPKKINGYKICYNCGYETLPDDLRGAVMDLVTYYLKNESTVGSATATDSGSVTINYVNSNALPQHIKRVLDLYTSYY